MPQFGRGPPFHPHFDSAAWGKNVSIIPDHLLKTLFIAEAAERKELVPEKKEGRRRRESLILVSLPKFPRVGFVLFGLSPDAVSVDAELFEDRSRICPPSRCLSLFALVTLLFYDRHISNYLPLVGPFYNSCLGRICDFLRCGPSSLILLNF